MDKTSIGFLADVLYIKGIICYEEFEAIQDAVNPADVAIIVDRMLEEDFNGHTKPRIRGEGYIGYRTTPL